MARPYHGSQHRGAGALGQPERIHGDATHGREIIGLRDHPKVLEAGVEGRKLELKGKIKSYF